MILRDKKLIRAELHSLNCNCSRCFEIKNKDIRQKLLEKGRESLEKEGLDEEEIQDIR